MAKCFLHIVTILVIFSLTDRIVQSDTFPDITLLWDVPVNTHIYDIATGDLDGDGISDVVASVVDWGSIGWSVTAVKGTDGSLLWRFNKTSKVGEVETGNFIGDEVNEVVIRDWDGNLFMLNGRNGDVLWKKLIGGSSELKVDDIDGDYIPEIITGGQNKIILLDYAGNTIWEFNGDLDDSIFSIGDLNNDNYKDIVAVTPYRSKGEAAVVYAINGKDGSQLWDYDIPVFSDDALSPNSVVTANINQDLNIDVVVAFGVKWHTDTHSMDYQVSALFGELGNEIWKHTGTMSSNVLELISGDLNNDGVDDVLKFGNEVFAFDGISGDILWESFGHAATISDLNSDEMVEVIIGYSIYSGEDGTLITALPKKEGETVIGGVQVVTTGDITGNGTPEIITGHHPSTGFRAFEVLSIQPPPTIISVTPNHGLINGNTRVKITGTNFVSGTSVKFGVMETTDVKFISSTELLATTPPVDSGGKVDVVVINPDGQEAILEDGFMYIPLGDVSGNGTVSAYDAALILQYVVGLIDEFPVDRLGSPGEISPRNYILRLPDLSATAGKRVQVLIIIDDATGLLQQEPQPPMAGGLSLRYDATVLRAVSVGALDALNGAYWQGNVDLEGEVRFAFVSAFPQSPSPLTGDAPSPLVGEGRGEGKRGERMLMVEFEVLPNTEGWTSPLILENVNLSNSLTISRINGSITVIPRKTALLPNYPNPFNPETWIPFKLSKSAPVEVRIYDGVGKLVRVLNPGVQNAGVYLTKDKAVYWDGRSNIGEKVASGVYYYTLRAGDFTATRKMVVVK
ncbi:T9SS type A sorting domain-containing protein [Candidatus Poribacteria bacterium]|nr:T9SS type A sorting domain-containing protein [Candidatus Poribacteria bacterium]